MNSTVPYDIFVTKLDPTCHVLWSTLEGGWVAAIVRK
jgi:hypothetical protein